MNESRGWQEALFFFLLWRKANNIWQEKEKGRPVDGTGLLCWWSEQLFLAATTGGVGFRCGWAFGPERSGWAQGGPGTSVPAVDLVILGLPSQHNPEDIGLVGRLSSGEGEEPLQFPVAATGAGFFYPEPLTGDGPAFGPRLFGSSDAHVRLDRRQVDGL